MISASKIFRPDGTIDHEALYTSMLHSNRESNERYFVKAQALWAAGWTAETPHPTQEDIMSYYWRRPGRRPGKKRPLVSQHRSSLQSPAKNHCELNIMKTAKQSTAWMVEWVTKLGQRAGCTNQEWFRRKTDAADRINHLKRGGFKCLLLKDDDYNGPN